MVDAHEPVAGASQHLLGERGRQSGTGDQSEVLPFEPTVSAVHDLGAVDRIEETWDTEASSRPEGHDSPMHERFVEPSIAEARVERHRESLATLGARKVDQGRSRFGRR